MRASFAHMKSNVLFSTAARCHNKLLLRKSGAAQAIRKILNKKTVIGEVTAR
jgi:hypothetical protein